LSLDKREYVRIVPAWRDDCNSTRVACCVAARHDEDVI
jgi:hypothetical protein